MAYLGSFLAIVPKDEVERQGGVLKHPIGTGPYKFVEWKPDRYVLLERYPNYTPQPGPMNGMGGERIAYFDKIKWIPIPEESAATMAFLNKEIDFLYLVPFKNIELFRNNYSKQGLVVDESPGLSWYGIFLGCDKPITSDLKFRQACAYAIDREVVTKGATRGHATVNSSVVATANQYYTAAHKKWYKKDPGRAKELLKESSYRGEEIPFLTTRKYAMMYDQSLVVQSELASIGIKTKLEILEWPLLVDRLFSGKFQMVSYGMSARPDPAIAFDNLKNTGLQKQYPRFLEILDEATKTMDYEKRKRLFEEAHGLVYAGVPTIICFNYNIYNGYWNHVKGFKIWATNQPRFWGVWSDK